MLSLAQFFMLVFSGVIFYWGIEFTQFGWNQTSELADIPMWLIFIAWPIADFMVIPMLIVLLAVIVFPEIALFVPRIFSPEVIN